MTCNHPITIVNPKFKKKYYNENGRPYDLSQPEHRRLAQDFEIDRDHPDWFIQVPCGHCFWCRKRIANSWRFRINEEILQHGRTRCYFVTLTISQTFYREVTSDISGAIRRFRDRYRKATGSSLRYWLIPEVALGDSSHDTDDGRGRLHFHGFIFAPSCSASKFATIWKYGFVSRSVVRNPAAAACYVTKYVLKGRDYGMFRIYCSPGLGKEWLTNDRKSYLLHNPGVYMDVQPDGKSRLIPRYYIDKVFKPLNDDTRLIYRLEHPPKPEWRLGKMVYKDYFLYKRDRDHMYKIDKDRIADKRRKLHEIHKRYPGNFFIF